MKLNNKKKFAIICSGGSAPGMATCVISFVKKCMSEGVTPIAFANGFEGLHDNQIVTLSNNFGLNFLDDGSALIGTSRCSKFREDTKYRKHCVEVLKRHGIDALIVVGGEGSYKGALDLAKLGVKVITIPATIDNDIPSTSYTVGFDTCLNTVCRVVSEVNDVFVSHHGIALIELMGKGCPDVTVRSAIANNATYMVTKYSKLKPEGFLKVAKAAFAKGKPNVTFLVTEKLYPSEGDKSLKAIAKWLEKETGCFTRHVVVGYIQRGGRPSARDRLLANYMVNIAVDQLLDGKYNKAICRKARKTTSMDLTKAVAMKRKSGNRPLVSIFNKINQE
ncbi:MAG: ATP-dependent 6-phosphofructokinase [Mycoplasma sp.]|nr:ATP-dependent 6-phosphofructokinase [Candidatus Hennigella equi]